MWSHAVFQSSSDSMYSMRDVRLRLVAERWPAGPASLRLDLRRLVGRVVEHQAVAVAEDVVADPAQDAPVPGREHRGQDRLHQRLAGLAVLAGRGQRCAARPVPRAAGERRPERRREVDVGQSQVERREGVKAAGRQGRRLAPVQRRQQRGQRAVLVAPARTAARSRRRSPRPRRIDRCGVAEGREVVLDAVDGLGRRPHDGGLGHVGEGGDGAAPAWRAMPGRTLADHASRSPAHAANCSAVEDVGPAVQGRGRFEEDVRRMSWPPTTKASAGSRSTPASGGAGRGQADRRGQAAGEGRQAERRRRADAAARPDHPQADSSRWHGVRRGARVVGRINCRNAGPAGQRAGRGTSANNVASGSRKPGKTEPPSSSASPCKMRTAVGDSYS